MFILLTVVIVRIVMILIITMLTTIILTTTEALEINLLSKSGLTDDSILSVRAGPCRSRNVYTTNNNTVGIIDNSHVDSCC